MTGWRHAERFDNGDCRVVLPYIFDHCGCTTPTPDPTSQCAVCGRDGATHVQEVYIAPLGHDHQPTRCTCGHPMEADRG